MSSDELSSMSKDDLLFVYNADSGFLNMLKDWTHKIVSPSTYNCQLCALTYGNTGMRQKWHSFISGLPFDALFLHRDEFHKEYSDKKEIPLPCIFIIQKRSNRIQLLLDAETINRQQTLDQLIDTCSRSVASIIKQ